MSLSSPLLDQDYVLNDIFQATLAQLLRQSREAEKAASGGVITLSRRTKTRASRRSMLPGDTADAGPAAVVALSDIRERFHLVANTAQNVEQPQTLPYLPAGRAVWKVAKIRVRRSPRPTTALLVDSGSAIPRRRRRTRPSSATKSFVELHQDKGARTRSPTASWSRIPSAAASSRRVGVQAAPGANQQPLDSAEVSIVAAPTWIFSAGIRYRCVLDS